MADAERFDAKATVLIEMAIKPAGMTFFKGITTISPMRAYGGT